MTIEECFQEMKAVNDEQIRRNGVLLDKFRQVRCHAQSGMDALKVQSFEDIKYALMVIAEISDYAWEV